MGARGVQDEEFLKQLYKGGELLAAGKVIEAKDHLEKAYTLQPKNEKGQNLLGLAYFKLGLFDRAAEIYEALVNENPADPTLRVNLGLVYLKTNALPRAMREFETATDLAPDHKKAHNYLGLALAQGGQYARAKEHFILAGSDAMVEKMAKAVEGPRAPVPEAEVKELSPPPEQTAPSEETALEVMSEDQSPPSFDEPPSGATALPVKQWYAPPQPQDEEMRFAEDEGPPALNSDPPVAEVSGDSGQELTFETQPNAAQELTFESRPAPVDAPAEDVERTSVFGVPALRAAAIALQDDEVRREQAPAIDATEMTFDAPQPDRTQVPFPVENARHFRASSVEPTIEVSPLEDPGLPDGEGVLSVTEVGDPEPPSRTLRLAEMPEREVAREEAPTSPAVLISHPAAAITAGAARAFQQLQPPPFAPAGAPVLAELSPRILLAEGPLEGPFQVSAESVAVVVQGELLTRLSGLLSYVGNLTVQAESMRFRGRPTDKPFGHGADQLARVSGVGVVFIRPGEKDLYTSIDLDDESAYFFEPVVFAFEEGIMFENGRVPTTVPPELDLVHLRGKGKVLLRLKGALRSLEVRQDRPVVLPMERLVGWHGSVTPRTTELATGQVSAVELVGEGYALFTA